MADDFDIRPEDVRLEDLPLPRGARLGPGGSAIVRRGSYKAVGLVPGARRPMTQARLAASRTNAIKTGRFARFKNMAPEEALAMAVARQQKNPRAPQAIAAYVRALTGDTSELDVQSAERLGKRAALFDQLQETVEKDGPIIVEETRDPNGTVIASRSRLHPAIDAAERIGAALGLTGDRQLLTPASRVTARRDDAMRRYLDRREALRRSLSENAITVEVVPEATEK